MLETAGASEGEQNQVAVGNKAIMQGIDNPDEIRELILDRVRRSRSAGLGDEPIPLSDGRGSWRTEHITVLREILIAVHSPQ